MKQKGVGGRIALTILLISLLLLLCACSGGGGDGDDVSGDLRNNTCGDIEKRIVNGTQCSLNDSPVVKLEVTVLGLRPFTCSGTMISKVDILTAGHCLRVSARPVVSVVAVVEGRNIEASGYAVHPDYLDQTPFRGPVLHDVAVVRLGSAIDFTPLRFAVSKPVEAGSKISIYGYGFDEESSLGVLRSGEMVVSEVSEDFIVAKFNGDGSNICDGDSGGPALFSINDRYGIVGVSSTGRALANCGPGDTVRFTNMQSASNREFVEGVAASAGDF